MPASKLRTKGRLWCALRQSATHKAQRPRLRDALVQPQSTTSLVALAKQLGICTTLHSHASSITFRDKAVEVSLRHSERKVVARMMRSSMPLLLFVSVAAGDVQLDNTISANGTMELDDSTIDGAYEAVTSTEAPDPYECNSDLYHWSEPHRQWCCTNMKRGCADIPFDCASGYMDWEYGWSDEKKAYCCLEKGIACYDCNAEVEHWEYKWSQGKRDFCCLQEDKGCYVCNDPNPNWLNEWSQEKQDWCCKTAGTGCEDGATTTASTTAVATTTAQRTLTTETQASDETPQTPPAESVHQAVVKVPAEPQYHYEPYTAPPGSTLPPMTVSPVPAGFFELLTKHVKKLLTHVPSNSSAFTISALLLSVFLALSGVALVRRCRIHGESFLGSAEIPDLELGVE